MAKIWVFTEQDGDAPTSLGLELLGKARQLGETTVILSGPGSQTTYDLLGEHGAEMVLHVDPGDRLPSGPVATALAEQAGTNPPDVILFGQAYNDRDIAARLAVRLGVGILSNTTDIQLTADGIETTHEILGGSQIATASLTQSPYIILVRPKSFTPQPIGGSPPRVEELALPDPGGSDATIDERHIEEREGPQLGEASIVVSGGRGLGTADAYALIEQLAKKLGAATGATRAIVDAGWVPYAKQVGQTGKTVKPDIYIACGISGAMQHLVGMKDSKTIIAINKDPDAPIHTIADLAITGDIHKILPKLIDALPGR